MSKYSNLPVSNNFDPESTAVSFENYYEKDTEIDPTTLAVVKGFFTSRHFGETAAESIAGVIIKQAKQDGYNPMTILDTLKGLDSLELSGLVSEILNYNRFKTSSLGYAQEFQTNIEIKRNIVV